MAISTFLRWCCMCDNHNACSMTHSLMLHWHITCERASKGWQLKDIILQQAPPRFMTAPHSPTDMRNVCSRPKQLYALPCQRESMKACLRTLRPQNSL